MSYGFVLARVRVPTWHGPGPPSRKGEAAAQSQRKVRQLPPCTPHQPSHYSCYHLFDARKRLLGAGQPECTGPSKRVLRLGPAGSSCHFQPMQGQQGPLSTRVLKCLSGLPGLAKISSLTSLVSLVNRRELQMPTGASKFLACGALQHRRSL